MMCKKRKSSPEVSVMRTRSAFLLHPIRKLILFKTKSTLKLYAKTDQKNTWYEKLLLLFYYFIIIFLFIFFLFSRGKNELNQSKNENLICMKKKSSITLKRVKKQSIKKWK